MDCEKRASSVRSARKANLRSAFYKDTAKEKAGDGGSEAPEAAATCPWFRGRRRWAGFGGRIARSGAQELLASFLPQNKRKKAGEKRDAGFFEARHPCLDP